jgi:F-type H+-transporting ATPase subunit a
MGPLKHIGNFIKVKQFFKIKSLKDLPMAFLDFFLGLLDIVGEVAKLASLSTRLFGNIFAGMVIIMIIQGLSAYSQFLAPVPFLVLSTLSGFVQAFVFAMLSILFVSSSINAVNPPADKQTN